jgi:hypothetical protein
MTAKFWFLLNTFEISKFHTFRWQKFKKSISQLPSSEAQLFDELSLKLEQLFLMPDVVKCWIHSVLLRLYIFLPRGQIVVICFL